VDGSGRTVSQYTVSSMLIRKERRELGSGREQWRERAQQDNNNLFFLFLFFCFFKVTFTQTTYSVGLEFLQGDASVVSVWNMDKSSPGHYTPDDWHLQQSLAIPAGMKIRNASTVTAREGKRG
jgi:hypothetical protein